MGLAAARNHTKPLAGRDTRAVLQRGIVHEERHGVRRDAAAGADSVQSFCGGGFNAYVHCFYP